MVHKWPYFPICFFNDSPMMFLGFSPLLCLLPAFRQLDIRPRRAGLVNVKKPVKCSAACKGKIRQNYVYRNNTHWDIYINIIFGINWLVDILEYY